MNMNAAFLWEVARRFAIRLGSTLRRVFRDRGSRHVACRQWRLPEQRHPGYRGSPMTSLRFPAVGLLFACSAFVLLVSSASAQTLTPQGPAPGESLLIQSTDPIVGFDSATLGGNSNYANGSLAYPGGPGNWPNAEPPQQCINISAFNAAAGNSTADCKYLNFSGVGAGFYITPSAPSLSGGPSVLTGIEFATANDTPSNQSRNPVTVSIEGSNAPSYDLSYGTSWTTIASSLSTGLGAIVGYSNSWAPEQTVANTTAYTSYRIIITGQQGGITSPGSIFQFGQVELFGTAPLASLVWTGSTNSIWSLAGSDTNWSSSSQAYSDGSNVIFDNSNTSGHTSINIANPGVQPASVTFNNSSLPYVFSGAAISGASRGISHQFGGQRDVQ